MNKQDLIEVKLEADSFIISLNNSLIKYKEILSDSQDNIDLNEKLLVLITELNESLKSDKYTEIVSKYDELQTSYQALDKLVNSQSKEKLKDEI